MAGIILFLIALVLLFGGYSVAYAFAGISLIVGSIVMGLDLFAFIPYRVMSIMENTIMMAIPMFIFMGVVLQKTGLAERLLESMGKISVRTVEAHRRNIKAKLECKSVAEMIKYALENGLKI